MAEPLNYADFYKSALEAAGGPASEVLPTNTYKCKIGMVKSGTAKSGKFQVGIRFNVLDGEHAGKNTWINQTLTTENPKAFGVFLKYMLQLGVPQSALDAGTPVESLVDYIVVGTEGMAALAGDRVYDGKARQDLKSFTITGVPMVSTSGVQIPQAPGAVAPVAQTPVASPVPVAVPVAVAPVAPVPVAVVGQPVAPVAAPAVPF